jgi:hypothetical protein
VLIVGTDGPAVEMDLIGGRLGCPTCGLVLRPWGHGIAREVRLLAGSERRRFRRSVCRSCGVTHVLVPEDTLVRRRDAAEVIGAALVDKANGSGHRKIASALGRPASTVRGWLRRFASMAVALREHFTRWASAIDPTHDRRSPGGSELFDAVEAVGVLGVVAAQHLGPRPPWSLASFLTGGHMLCNTSSPWVAPV